MAIILLIRHGETDFNKKHIIPGRLPNVHLNKKGQQQARQLADTLGTAPIKAIYASPLERTLETAEPLANDLKLDVIPLPDLLETDCGTWCGQPVSKLRRLKTWKIVQQHPSQFHFPGGETIADCQHRMVRALETLRLQAAPLEVLACFSHADPIKEAVAYYLGLSLDQFQRLAVDLASVTALHITDEGSRLLLLNYRPGLPWDLLKPPKHMRRAIVEARQKPKP